MTAPVLFDRALHRRRLDRAAPTFGAADFLKRRAAEDAVFRLEAILRDFPVAVDLGARNGVFGELLAQSPARERVGLLVESELSERMIRGRDGARLLLDEERLPLGVGSINLAVSLLAMQWVNDVPGALIQIRRALKPDGLFLGAVFGGATLNELRHSLLHAEAEVRGGAGLRVSPFMDPVDGTGLLQRAGLSDPVVDVDKLTVRYEHPLRLMQDLRRMGDTNALLERDRTPLSRPVLARAFEIYAERFGHPDGRIPATFEIVMLTGWTAPEVRESPAGRRPAVRQRAASGSP